MLSKRSGFHPNRSSLLVHFSCLDDWSSASYGVVLCENSVYNGCNESPRIEGFIVADKIHTIVTLQCGRMSEMSGTFEELFEHFDFTVGSGAVRDSRINRYPKTVRGLVSSLNKAAVAL